MYKSVALTCQIVSSLSLLANIYLAYLYFCCPVKSINFYKHFFLGTALQNLLFSTCFILLAPILMSENFAYVFLAYGPLRQKNEGQALMITLSRDFAFAFLAYGPLREREEGLGLMVLFCIAFVSSMVLVTDSFIYRYLQFCKLAPTFSTKGC
ncbi:unnamed protein product [Heligmosomoides polygyrus]|uniref:7TM_GPCR_Srx domain-containing protein n=1 Tax=Heligmosomoides polygyrus TaxID=6339 RepID=A0A183GJ67_HELPZ|nr:unnamed protein product [Heligmosomoides polygyrus]